MACLVNRNAFKDKPFRVAGFQRSNLKDGIDAKGAGSNDREHLHPSLHDSTFDIKESGHFNGAAERNFSVTLRKVHVTHTEAATCED
jgi:hypothetical protein